MYIVTMSEGKVIKFIDQCFVVLAVFTIHLKKFGFKCVMASDIYDPAKIHKKTIRYRNTW